MARDGHLTRPLTVKNLEEVLGEIYTSRQSRVLSFFKNLKEDAEGETDE
jgi:hypothetical protein